MYKRTNIQMWNASEMTQMWQNIFSFIKLFTKLQLLQYQDGFKERTGVLPVL